MSDEKRGWLALVLGPATLLMDRFRYLAKFVLIGLVVFVPLAALTYINLRTLTEQVEFSRKEHLGVQYLTPLRPFLLQVQRHRLLSVALAGGDRSVESELQASRQEADRSAADVNAIDGAATPGFKGTYGDLMRTTDYWKRIQGEWDALKDRRFATPAEADQAHEAVTAKLVDLVLNYVANYSNLILDPDLDSYWLMDAYVGKLPSVTQTVARATALALRPSEEGVERQLDLAGYYKLTQSTVIDLRDVNFATAFKETPNFGNKVDLERNLKEPLAGVVASVNRHADGIKLAFAAGSLSSQQQHALLVAGLSTLDQVHAFWSATGPELDSLCVKRFEEKYGNRRTLSVALAGLILGLVLYLFAGFYLSVRRSVASLGAATARMISGTSETFRGTSRDELGEVFKNYNDINAALVEARTLRAKVEDDNRSLQANIMDLLLVVSQASEGDLTAKAQVTSGALGNVADAFNELQGSLQRLIGEIMAQQARTNDVVSQIRSASQSMAQGATNQAREILAATQVVERISSEIERVSANARDASQAAARTEQSAVEGTKAVDDVVQGMDQLRSNVQSGAKKVKALGDRSMEISSIVSVINRISEQTNMLALNAAIEAARAGEHGRGFSVVAEEVRKLAERTAQATQDIDRLVRGIQVETTETVTAIEVQTEVVERESEMVGQAGSSLARIREVSGTSAGLVNQISEVAQQQVEGARSVTRVMAQISTIAQETQQGAQGAVASMAELVKVQEQLAQSIRRFKLA